MTKRLDSQSPADKPSAEEMANDLERAVEQHRRRESPRGAMSMHETYVVRLIEALRTRSAGTASSDIDERITQYGFFMRQHRFEEAAEALVKIRAALSTRSARERIVTEEMVSRFLSWKLPPDFSPDCGIHFDGRKPDQWNADKGWPIGTNLLTATQARPMLEHILGKS